MKGAGTKRRLESNLPSGTTILGRKDRDGRNRKRERRREYKEKPVRVRKGRCEGPCTHALGPFNCKVPPPQDPVDTTSWEEVWLPDREAKHFIRVCLIVFCSGTIRKISSATFALMSPTVSSPSMPYPPCNL